MIRFELWIFPPDPFLNGVESFPLKAVRGCFVLQAPPCADVMHPGCVFLMSVLGRVLARRREAVAQHSWDGREGGSLRAHNACSGRNWQLMLSTGKFTVSLLPRTPMAAPPTPSKTIHPWELTTHHGRALVSWNWCQHPHLPSYVALDDDNKPVEGLPRLASLGRGKRQPRTFFWPSLRTALSSSQRDFFKLLWYTFNVEFVFVDMSGRPGQKASLK